MMRMASRSRLRFEKSAGHPLIMSLILSLCFVILLALGIACTDYAEADSAVSVTTLVELNGPSDVPSGDGAAGYSDPQRDAVLDTTSGSSALMGSAICVLGVMCGFAFTVLRRRLLRRPALDDRGPAPFVRLAVPTPHARPRATGLSLAQLSLSRT